MLPQRPQAVDVGDVEDQPPAPAQFRCRGLRQEQRHAQVGADEVVELGRGDRAERRRVEAGGVVHEHVQRAEGADHGGGQGGQRGRIGEVRLERRGGAGPRLVHRVDQRARFGRRTPEVDRDFRAARVEGLRDHGADASGRARDEHDLVLERHCRDGDHPDADSTRGRAAPQDRGAAGC